MADSSDLVPMHIDEDNLHLTNYTNSSDRQVAAKVERNKRYYIQMQKNSSESEYVGKREPGKNRHVTKHTLKKVVTMGRFEEFVNPVDISTVRRHNYPAIESKKMVRRTFFQLYRIHRDRFGAFCALF